jgi:hypothetical protein
MKDLLPNRTSDSLECCRRFSTIRWLTAFRVSDIWLSSELVSHWLMKAKRPIPFTDANEGELEPIPSQPTPAPGSAKSLELLSFQARCACLSLAAGGRPFGRARRRQSPRCRVASTGRNGFGLRRWLVNIHEMTRLSCRFYFWPLRFSRRLRWRGDEGDWFFLRWPQIRLSFYCLPHFAAGPNSRLFPVELRKRSAFLLELSNPNSISVVCKWFNSVTHIYNRSSDSDSAEIALLGCGTDPDLPLELIGVAAPLSRGPCVLNWWRCRVHSLTLRPSMPLPRHSWIAALTGFEHGSAKFIQKSESQLHMVIRKMYQMTFVLQLSRQSIAEMNQLIRL